MLKQNSFAESDGRRIEFFYKSFGILSGVVFVLLTTLKVTWGVQLPKAGQAIQLQGQMNACVDGDSLFQFAFGLSDSPTPLSNKQLFQNRKCGKLPKKLVIVISTVGQATIFYQNRLQKRTFIKGYVTNKQPFQTVRFTSTMLPSFSVLSKNQCKRVAGCAQDVHRVGIDLIALSYWGDSEESVCFDAESVASNTYWDALPGAGSRSEGESIDNMLKIYPALRTRAFMHERNFFLSIVHYIFIHVSELPRGSIDAGQIAKTTCQKEYYKFPFEKGHFLKHRGE